MSAKFFLGITLLATLPLRAEVDASKSTMPEKFQSAPGLIKGGFLWRDQRNALRPPMN